MAIEPAIGRIVHFILASGARPGMHRPAVIVSCDPPRTMSVNVQVFCDGNKGAEDGKDHGDGLGNMFWRRTVPFDPEAKQHGSWHWPEDHTINASDSRRHD